MGPEYQFSINLSNISAYVPSASEATIAELTTLLPRENISSTRLDLLGILIGTAQYVDAQIGEKLDSRATTLESLNDIPDARIKFHMRRVSASTCKV